VHCEPQQPPGPDDGCGHELDHWFSEANLHPNLSGGEKHLLTLSNLPPECRQVLMAP
jgi:penicillin-insensitive murein endopeptidase